jgi:hypothetical protein
MPSQLVDGEDSSEEDEPTQLPPPAGSPAALTGSGSGSHGGGVVFNSAAFVPEPTNPIVASVQAGLLPIVQEQLSAIQQLTRQHEGLLASVQRESRVVEALETGDMQAALEVLRLAPQYEYKVKAMLQQMAQLSTALSDLDKDSEAILGEVAAGVEVRVHPK